MKERLQSYKTLSFYELLVYDHYPSHDEMKRLREVHLLQSSHSKEWDIKNLNYSKTMCYRFPSIPR